MQANISHVKCLVHRQGRDGYLYGHPMKPSKKSYTSSRPTSEPSLMWTMSSTVLDSSPNTLLLVPLGTADHKICYFGSRPAFSLVSSMIYFPPESFSAIQTRRSASQCALKHLGGEAFDFNSRAPLVVENCR